MDNFSSKTWLLCSFSPLHQEREHCYPDMTTYSRTGGTATGQLCSRSKWCSFRMPDPHLVFPVMALLLAVSLCFSLTYVKCGLNLPTHSQLAGPFWSYCITGLALANHFTREGDWYPADLGKNDFKGLYGYKQKRDEVFLKDRIPTWFAASDYVGLATISIATMLLIFPSFKWYLVLCSYIIAPALAFCNSYGTGLTDWNLASTYGKIGLFIISSLVGSNGGGVLAELAASGIMMSIVSTVADLMQDFKTGYLTLS